MTRHANIGYSQPSIKAALGGGLRRYRRLNTIFERTEAHLVAFIEIAFISILSRRLVRLVA